MSITAKQLAGKTVQVEELAFQFDSTGLSGTGYKDGRAVAFQLCQPDFPSGDSLIFALRDLAARFPH